MDPIDLRLKNAAKKGTKTAYGVTFNTIGMVETLEAVKNSRALQDAAQAGLWRAASPPASGSTSAPIPAPPATSARTAR